MPSDPEEIARLRREFDALPKAPEHGEQALERHGNILPEWVMQIIAEPFETFKELDNRGREYTIITGRVPESRQWIRVVFEDDFDTGAFLTAYNDRRLVSRYGGRPWDIR